MSATVVPEVPRVIGVSCCTLTGGTRVLKDMKLGPDGDKWVTLSFEELTKLCSAPGFKARHSAKGKITHLCAGYGTWAFTVFASSMPHGVAFLHIRPPGKLDALAGDEGTLIFTGRQLLDSYKHAETTYRTPRVWRRQLLRKDDSIAHDELAINFCLLTHLGAAPLDSKHAA